MRPFILAFVCLLGCDARILAPGESPFDPVIPGGAGSGSGSGSGSGGGEGGGTVVMPQPNPCELQNGAVVVGAAPMRRLSHDEYRNTISDLQPGWSAAASTQAALLTPDSESLGFRNAAAFLDVKPVLATQYLDAAEALAAQAVAGTNLNTLAPCAAGANELTCAQNFIRTFGRRLHRHTLTAEEVARYTAVYTSARTAMYDYRTGIEWVVFAFLNSPGFLYRVELDPAGSSGVRKVSGLELASRLSYLLWQSAPDETLLAAAEGGQLTSRPEILAQAERMLADTKARRLTAFFDQWLKWDKLETMSREPSAFPGLPMNLGPMMRAEAQNFVERTVFDVDGKLGTLLTGEYTYVNQALATHYGLGGVTGTAFQRVATSGRGGVLTLGGTLAANDLATRTSIVHRGVSMRTQVMCQIVPAPPPDIPALGPISSTLTQAQRLAMHRADPTCAGCHNLIDPLGTPFEAFDAVGRARTQDEAGNPVDTRGELTRGKDVALNGPVANASELVAKFAQSTEVRDCFATQLYRFSVGRKEENGDACTTYTMKKRFNESGGDVKAFLLTLTQLDDFDHRQVQP
ncbi:MAG: DUF1592 domain-containing protein [Myxococcaceae bacterium]|nr:DUF1592 domain-containing protein [Myxococcaceae bacterium]